MFAHPRNQVGDQRSVLLSLVTHAVGNVGKRIFVIGFTILAYGNKISMQTAIGSGIAVVGAGLHGLAEGEGYADQTKTLKRGFKAADGPIGRRETPIARDGCSMVLYFRAFVNVLEPGGGRRRVVDEYATGRGRSP